MTLEQHLREAAQEAEGIFAIQGAIHPMMHAITEEGKHLVIGVPHLGGTDDEKTEAADAVRIFLREKKVVQFVLMLEAWTIDLTNVPPDTPVPRPSESKDRREIVAFTAASRNEGEIQGRMDIIRPKNERPYLGKLEIYRPTHVEGRFVGLLPVETRMQ
jgi:hypothetical protein